MSTSMVSKVFIKVLPSPIFCSGSPTSWKPFTVKAEDQINVFPMLASGGPGRSQHPWVNVEEALKLIPTAGGNLNGLPPKRIFQVLTIEPTKDKKLRLIPIDAKIDDPLDVYPSDTIIYEILGKMSAQKYLNEFFLNLRRYTRQVWIGRFASYTDLTTSVAFELDDGRKGHGAVYSFESLTVGYHKTVRLCTEEIWREAWKNSMAPIEELGVDIVHPAHHALLSDHDQEFFIQVGITIERLKYLLWDHLRDVKKCTNRMHRAALNDTSKPQRYFSEILDSVCERSLLRENLKAHTSVKMLWIARGLIAHGKQLIPELSARDKMADLENIYALALFVDSIRGKKYPTLIY